MVKVIIIFVRLNDTKIDYVTFWTFCINIRVLNFWSCVLSMYVWDFSEIGLL